MKLRSPRIFIQSENISRHLICSICHEVFDNPNRMLCGHTFCYICIQQWASMSKLCPLCKKSLRHRKPQKDLIAASLVDELKSKCFHQNCEWTGVYSSLKKHQRACSYRQKKIYEQTNQGLIVKLSDDEYIRENLQEAEQPNSKGRKKRKENEQKNKGPIFPSSDESLNLDLQPLQQARDQTEATWHKQQSIRNQNFTRSQSLNKINNSTNVDQNCQKAIQMLNKRKSKDDEDKLIDEQNANNISEKLSEISIDDVVEQEKSQKSVHQTNKDTVCLSNGRLQSNFFYLFGEPLLPGNHYLLEKRKKQQQRDSLRRSQRKRNVLNWGKANLSKRKQKILTQSDSNDFDNPFDESVIEYEKKPETELIVLDSSDQSARPNPQISSIVHNLRSKKKDRILQSEQDEQKNQSKPPSKQRVQTERASFITKTKPSRALKQNHNK